MKKYIKFIIVILVVCIIGVGIFFFVDNQRKSNEKINKSENSLEEKNNSDSNSVETEEDSNITNAKNGTELIKKVYADKEYICANTQYASTKTNKHVNTKDGEVINGKTSYNSSEEINIPYINIDSQDATYVNSKMEELYDKAYEMFKDEYTAAYIKYEKYYYKNTASVLVTYQSFAISPMGCPPNEVYAYTFNLDTGKLMTTDEIYKLSVFDGDKTKINNEIQKYNNDYYNLEEGWEPICLDNSGNIICTITESAMGQKEVITLMI